MDNLEKLKKLFLRLDSAPKSTVDSGLYLMANEVTRHYYIGFTRRMGARQMEHFYALNKGTHACKKFQTAFIENNQFDMVAHVTGDSMHLSQLEYILIKKYKDDPFLLNAMSVTPYTEERLRSMAEKASKFRHSDETKKRLKQITQQQWSSEENRKAQSERRKKFFAEGGFKYNLGIKHPEEFGRKVSETKKKNWAAMTDEQRQEYTSKRTQSFTKPVVIEGKTYSSAATAAKELGMTRKKVRNRIYNKAYSDWQYV